MSRCASCRFWDASGPDADKRKPDGFGACSSEQFVIGYAFDDIQPSGVAVEGDEGWGFYTGPEFGCIHHQERP